MNKMISQAWREQYAASLKGVEVEDEVDLYFYRPVGFLCAKVAHVLGLSPTQLTILGMLFGVLSGLFYFMPHGFAPLLASAFLIFSGVLDSADGQLARMSLRTSTFGLVLDGASDTIVFSAVYIGCTLALVPAYGPGIWILAVAAGVGHSIQSAALDFYNREFLFFGCGKSSYWNPDLVEAGQAIDDPRESSLAWRLRRSWLWQQQLVSGRSRELRLLFREALAGGRSPAFQERYRALNRIPLRYWQLLGTNTHTFLIIFFALIGRFEFYLLVEFVIMNLWLILARRAQRAADAVLLEEIHAH